MNEYGLKKKTRGQARQIRRVQVMTAAEAVKLVKDADVVAMCGCGGGINEATELICALAERYRQTQTPRDLTFYHSTGLGDRGDKGMSPLAQKGLVKRDIGGHWGPARHAGDDNGLAHPGQGVLRPQGRRCPAEGGHSPRPRRLPWCIPVPRWRR